MSQYDGTRVVPFHHRKNNVLNALALVLFMYLVCVRYQQIVTLVPSRNVLACLLDAGANPRTDRFAPVDAYNCMISPTRVI